jgi:hypothetical protein
MLWPVSARCNGASGSLCAPDALNPSAIAVDDLVSVGVAEFARHVLTWKPRHSLNTHYRKAVIGALADAAYFHRNALALGEMESDSQRFLRTHPHLETGELLEGLRRQFPDLTQSEFEHELNTYRNLCICDGYSETATGDDDGDYDQNGDFKSAGETVVNGDPDDLTGGPVSQWSRRASHHDKLDRYPWSFPRIVLPIGWERRELEDRLAPIIKVTDQEPITIKRLGPPIGPGQDEAEYRSANESQKDIMSKCASILKLAGTWPSSLQMARRTPG